MEDDTTLSDLEELLAAAAHDTSVIDSLCSGQPGEEHLEALVRIIDLESEVAGLKQQLRDSDWCPLVTSDMLLLEDYGRWAQTNNERGGLSACTEERAMQLKKFRNLG